MWVINNKTRQKEDWTDARKQRNWALTKAWAILDRMLTKQNK